MRTACLLFALTLAACADPFAAAQKADTIEAYEQYLADHAEGRFAIQAKARLEQLYLEKARAEKSLEAYDAYLARFPEGALHDKALTEREEFLFEWARATDTLAAWEKFLEEYPRAHKDRRNKARNMVGVHGYRQHLHIGEVTIEQVNLAEDPEGPKDGWGFRADVTNNGPSVIASLWLTIDYLDAEGRALDSREWPVVAPRFPVPMEEEHLLPMKPGETRQWFWSTGNLPETWSQQVRLYPSRLELANQSAKAD